MVSILNQRSVADGNNITDYIGLSTDEMPNATNGSTFLMMDTGDKYVYSAEGDEWHEDVRGKSGGGGSADYTIDYIKPTSATTITIPDVDFKDVIIAGNSSSSGGSKYITINNIQLTGTCSYKATGTSLTTKETSYTISKSSNSTTITFATNLFGTSYHLMTLWR